MRVRMKAWEARQAGRDIMESILKEVFRYKTVRMIKNIVMEVVNTAEKESRTKMVFTDILLYGLTEGIKECIKIEERKKRILRKITMEKEWLEKRMEMPEPEVNMDWEEHSLEACMDKLGLETWDDTEHMTVDELESEEDWLDVWIKSIGDDDKSTIMVIN